VIIYADARFETVEFGLTFLKQALEKQALFFVEKPLAAFVSGGSCPAVVVSFEGQGIESDLPELEAGGFKIAIVANTVFVTGKDYTGTMYGLLDLAETIDLYGITAIKAKQENPFLKLRGVKFNLPFEPYAGGDPFDKNIATCLDTNFWRDYLDFLAANRYNCLSLWSEHPFHMMFRLAKYPDTCPYSDVELERYKQVYKFIFSHAKKRGIKIYLITWNIRLTAFIAKGLGLPEELGDMSDWYNLIYDERNMIPNNVGEFHAVRQHLEIIKDYFKECIKTLITTYRDLDGIGTNCAEEMVGDAVARQNWVMQTYLEAVEETGRDIPFIMRTNMGNGKTAKLFLDRYPSQDKFISWKYSNAHMYSHPEPQFEKLWGAWDGMDFEGIKVIYTVRNDDCHTLRWGDCDFLKNYLKGMKKPYVYGFYWGADGYIWADDFQHAPHGHKQWRYDFERHWHQFEMLGRLGYNPDLPEDIWVKKYIARYSKSWGERFYRGMKAASRIIPAVNRLFWVNYDFEWHPESLLSVFGFKTIKNFMDGKPMPGIGTVGIRDYVEKELNAVKTKAETPPDIIKILKEAVESIRKYTQELRAEIPAEYLGGDLECTLMDLEAWEQLGNYYYCKFTAALKLVYFEKTGDLSYKNSAVQCLEAGLESWQKLASIWSQHYLPYKMARVRSIFGWPYSIKDVKKDVEIARNM
jgi:hypothetical protein